MEHVRIENTGTSEAIPVNVVAGGAGDGSLLDGVDTGIKATIKDLTNSNPLTVAIVDGSGDQITSFGGGTQYTEDAAAAANPVGTAQILVRADTPSALVTTDGDNVALRGTNYGAAYTQIVTSTGSFVDSFGGGTQYTEGGTDASITGTVAMMEVAADTLQPIQGTVADGLLVNLGANNDVTVAGVATAANQTTGNTSLATIAGAVSGTEMQVDVLTMPSVAVTNVGTFAVQATGTVTANLAAGTNNIGDVDVLSLPALPAGTNNIGDVDVLTLPNVTLAAGTNTNEVVGDVAHSAAAAGNPVLIAGVAQAHDDTAPPNRVDAESDATRFATDFDGSLFVRPHGPQVWTYHLNTSTAQTDTTVHAAPGAGLSLYVGTIVFSSGDATAINMFLEEGASTIMGPYYLEAVAGRGMAVQFNPPRKITANTALTLTTSASIAHSVDITGFTAQG